MAWGVASFVLCVNVNPNIQSGFQPTAEPTGLQPVVAVSLCKERKMLPIMIMIVEWLVLEARDPWCLSCCWRLESLVSMYAAAVVTAYPSGLAQEMLGFPRKDSMPSFRRSMPKWSTPEHYSHNRMFPQYE